MKSYDEYIRQWDGQRVTKYGGECVAGVAEFEAENNLPIVWGNAKDWINNPIMLSAYDWVQNNPNDPNQYPPRGAIIIWDGNLPYSGGFGHIAFYDSNLGNHTMLSFGQNSGGPTMHFQRHSWDYVAGWYIPKYVAPPLWTTEPVNKVVKVKPGSHKWNLAQPNFESVCNNPITTADNNTIFTAVAILHHREIPQFNYYLEDAGTPHGWNVVDCDDYIPPAPQPEPAPVIIPNTTPTAPIKGNPAEKYTLVTHVAAFSDASGAKFHKGVGITINPGEYFVFKRDGKAINLTTNNVKDQNLWVNTDDNVQQESAQELPPPPVEAPPVVAVDPDAEWKKTLSPMRTTTGEPVVFINIMPTEVEIYDLTDPSKKIVMPPFKNNGEKLEVHLVATVEKDGKLYGRAANLPDWYCIPMNYLQVETVYYHGKTIGERLATNTGRLTDKLYYMWVKAENSGALSKLRTFIDGIKSTKAGK